MPTHPLISYMESPDGLGQDILSHSSASMPGAGSSMTPHCSVAEKPPGQTEGGLPVDCMFCDKTFQRQEDLSPHVLTQHPTTLFEPAVLRVEAEFLSPSERARAGPAPAAPAEKEERVSCVVCGQALDDPAELEGHMRKHKDSFPYSCGVCRRRFKEPWFLKNHMRTHVGKAGAKHRAQQDLETPVTINDVVQDQAPAPVSSPYRMCMVCGFFFPSKETLTEHSKVHNRESEENEDEDAPADAQPADTRPSVQAPLSQESFLQLFQLRSLSSEAAARPEKSAKWIAQLDPFNTYQAWQLATKGKIAVGPSQAKELGPDASSDNEDSCSDKEELGEIWAGGRGGKSLREGLRSELKSKHGGGDTPSPEPDQKSLMSKEKPTHCRDCGKTFRTYHQLVLHSRVHKKDRAGAESPTTSIDGKQSAALDRAEEYSEDGSEEGGAGDAVHSDKSEDYFDKSKLKILAPSKECSYCGKSFRSNYYLNIHLRTHTGEKPYKCEYCDYAAAQKTSLRYHLDRRHKDKPDIDLSKLVPMSPTASDAKEKVSLESLRASDGRQSAKASSSGGPGSVKAEAASSSQLPQSAPVKPDAKPPSAPSDRPHQKGLLPVNLKLEGQEIKEEESEMPLNLSFRMSLSVSATSVPKTALITNACPSCAYKTLYPEVLLMHKKLVHKEKPDPAKKNNTRSAIAALKQKRHTGCPPALEGKDVSPLPPFYRKHPRRTKSPVRQPEKPADKAQPSQHPQGLKQPAAAEPRRAAPPETQRKLADGASSSLGARPTAYRHPEQPEAGGSKKDCFVVSVKQGLPDRDRQVQAVRPPKNGAVWPSDAARSSLSSRFGSLPGPQVEFGEPSAKRLRYGGPAVREMETPEADRVRMADGCSRLMPSVKTSRSFTQGSPPSKVAHSLASMKGSSASGNGGDADWNVISILRSYSPSDLASLYHPALASSSHGAVSTATAGWKNAEDDATQPTICTPDLEDLS